MNARVRLGSGVEIELSGGETVVCDGATSAGDVGVVSHAHVDHLSGGAAPAVASALTADLAAVRTGRDVPAPTDHPAVELVNAGHVAGSRAALVRDEDADVTYCYTGDVCTRDRFHLRGFDPPDADVLVVESTYGAPEYVLPPHDDLVAEIVDWLDDTADRPALLFGYALGRAQKLQRLVARSGRGRPYVTDGVADVNAVVEAHRDVDFGAERFDAGVDLGPGDALVLPAGAKRRADVAPLLDRDDVVTAGFSGWAVDRSYRYRTGHDAAFPLSDHCDYAELLDLVAAVDPEVVYTHHGYADELAAAVTRELGIRARSLKKGQWTLADF